MTIVTLCGNQTNDADCGYCLQAKDCREKREQLCWGCRHELRGTCPAEYVRKMKERGGCRGRELITA